MAWLVTSACASRDLCTRTAGSSRRAGHGFRSMALAGVCARDSVEADVSGSSRRRGVVAARDTSWRRSRRVQALASLGRRHSRPAATPEARDRIHTPGAPCRQRSTRGVYHCGACKPQRSVETARGKLGPIGRTDQGSVTATPETAASFCIAAKPAQLSVAGGKLGDVVVPLGRGQCRNSTELPVVEVPAHLRLVPSRARPN